MSYKVCCDKCDNEAETSDEVSSIPEEWSEVTGAVEAWLCKDCSQELNHWLKQLT